MATWSATCGRSESARSIILGVTSIALGTGARPLQVGFSAEWRRENVGDRTNPTPRHHIDQLNGRCRTGFSGCRSPFVPIRTG
jgi:hypothetical protein